MPPLSYTCCHPVMCGRIPDRCACVCLCMEALWWLQPAAAASATIGPFSHTNEPWQKAQTETACMQIAALSCCLQAQYLRGCHRSVQICAMSLTKRQKARVNKVLTGVPAAALSEEEEDPPWGEWGTEGCLKGGNADTSSLQGQTDLWNFVWPPMLSLYFWWCSFHQVGPTEVFSSSFSFSAFFIQGFSQSVCDESASTL